MKTEAEFALELNALLDNQDTFKYEDTLDLIFAYVAQEREAGYKAGYQAGYEKATPSEQGPPEQGEAFICISNKEIERGTK